MGNDELGVAVFIVLGFCIFFTAVFLNDINGGDFGFHFEKAKNGCLNLRDDCQIYAPLFHWVSGPFAFHENSFRYFSVFLVGILTPISLFLLSKKWISVWLYFSVTSYFYFFVDGIYSQALAHLLFLAVLISKDWKLDFVFLLLATLAHGHGFFLVAFGILCKNIPFDRLSIEKIVPACSGIFGRDRPSVLDDRVGQLVTTGESFTWAHLLILFTKIIPLPFFYFGVKKVIEDRKFQIMAMVAGFLFAGTFISHRVYYLVPLVLIGPLAEYYQGLSGWGKQGFLAITVLFFSMNIYSWVNFKACLA